MSFLDTIAPLLAASLLGALIGLERQWRQRLAGLRTNALVALGAAAFVLFSGTVEADASPSRVVVQVVSGVGFLGAGVIMRNGGNVRGLNTAATLWCSAAAGVFSGGGHYLPALGCTLVVLAVNVLLRPVAHRMDEARASGREVDRVYRIELLGRAERQAYLRALVLHHGAAGAFRVWKVASDATPDGTRVTAELTGPADGATEVEQLVARLTVDPAVTSAGWSTAATSSEA